MDIISLLNEYNINFQTEGHKHCRPGWLNMSCIFCTGNPGLHLGFTLDGKRAYCWRCGAKNTTYVISKLLNVDFYHAEEIVKQYKGTFTKTKTFRTAFENKKEFQLPNDLSELKTIHKKYLIKRGFHPDFVEKEWNLRAAGPMSKVDEKDYRFRIIIPFYWDGEMVSFQGRDVTDQSHAKYKACPKDRELIHHKHIVYAHPEIDWSKPILVVEGAMDVWRLGRQAVGTFGIDFLNQQIRKLVRKKKEGGDNRVIVIYDNQKQAIKRANELIGELRFRGMCADIHVIKEYDDPGDMKQSDADKLVSKLIGD